MHVFHVAEQARWEAARTAGSYAWSTLGRTLEQEGFLHAARADQVAGVLERYYADVTEPLVLLTIETDLLTSPWREDPVGDTTYPHILGPLNPGAVVEVRPLPGPGRGAAEPVPDGRSFAQVFLAEMAFRMLAAVAVMVLATACGFAVALLVDERLAIVGLLAGLVVGVLLVLPFARRRRERQRN